MAKARTRGTVPLYVEVPEEVMLAFLAVVAATGRTKTDEVVDALRRHAAAPPEVIIRYPPPCPSKVEKDAPPAPKKPRARKKPG
jgi:hypothetical protein